MLDRVGRLPESVVFISFTCPVDISSNSVLLRPTRTKLKRVCIDYAKENKGKLPTEKELLKVVQGNFNPEKEKKLQKIALWVMTDVYPAVFGTTKYGDEEQLTMVLHKVPIRKWDQYPLFTVSNLAWVVVLILNCLDKWEAIAGWEMENPDKKAKDLPKRPSAATIKATPKDPEVLRDLTYHTARWTSSVKGQDKNCSWDHEGRQKYADLVSAISQFQQTNKRAVKKHNNEMLLKMQEKHAANPYWTKMVERKKWRSR